MKTLRFAGLAIAATLGMAASAQATTLTFDGSICEFGACADGSRIDQSYGDIAGQLDVQWDRNTSSNDVDNNFRFWAGNYSDLTNVGWGAENATAGPSEIFLMPLAGYQVTLTGFDLGAWPNVNRNTQITLVGGNGNPISTTGPITVNGQVHSSFLVGQTRTDGFRIQFGPDAFNVGIDNLTFDVTRISGGVVPEPGTWALMIGGFGMAGAMLRRRKAVVV